MMKDMLNTPWRIMSTAVYAPPNEGKIYGTADIDVTKAMDFIKKEREKGHYLTITHLVAAAIGRTLGLKVPEVNIYLRRGKLIPREDVIVTIAVNMGSGGEMSSVRIRQAHQKTVYDIAQEIVDKAKMSRDGTENKTMKKKHSLSKVPWPFRRWVFVLLKWITNDLGVELKSLGLAHDSFGSVLLTNIGSHGLTTGFAALFPASRLPAVVAMGKVEDKPVVVDGEIVIRKMITLSGVFDHRIMDGFHGGAMSTHVKNYLENPERLAETE